MPFWIQYNTRNRSKNPTISSSKPTPINHPSLFNHRFNMIRLMKEVHLWVYPWLNRLEKKFRCFSRGSVSHYLWWWRMFSTTRIIQITESHWKNRRCRTTDLEFFQILGESWMEVVSCVECRWVSFGIIWDGDWGGWRTGYREVGGWWREWGVVVSEKICFSV